MRLPILLSWKGVWASRGGSGLCGLWSTWASQGRSGLWGVWLQYGPAGEDLACVACEVCGPAGEDLTCEVCGYSTGQPGRIWPARCVGRLGRIWLVRCVVTEGSYLTKHITGSWDQGRFAGWPMRLGPEGARTRGCQDQWEPLSWIRFLAKFPTQLSIACWKPWNVRSAAVFTQPKQLARLEWNWNQNWKWE